MKADPPAPVRLHQSFVRDRRVEQQLRSALRALDAGNVEAALQSLQSLVELEDESFAQTDAASPGVAVRWEAQRLLSELPRSARDLYETIYGGVARAELKRMEALRPRKASVAVVENRAADGRAAVMREIARRYFHTDAGRMASKQLADLWLEQGDFEASAGLWRKLLADSRHVEAFTPVQKAKAAFVLYQAGDGEAARRIMGGLEERSIVLAGESLSGRDWLARFSPTATADLSSIQLVGYRPDPGQTPFPGSWSPSHNRSTGSPPVRSRLLWEQPLSGEHSRHVDPLIQAWQNYQRTNGLPTATANTPLVTDDAVVVRDFEGIRCVNLRDGTVRWRYVAKSALCRDIPAQLAVPIEGNPDPANLKRLWVGNALMGTVSGDGERVYAVEGVESRWNQGSVINADGQDPASMARRSNQLVALSVRGTSSDARPLWILGGPAPVTSTPAVVEPVPTPVAAPAAGIVGVVAPAIAPNPVAPVPAGVELVAAAPAEAPVGAPVTTGNSPYNSTSTEPDTLQGCFFLGVPTAVEGALYALVEFDQQLQIVSIEPRTGTVLWRKPVGLVATPVHLDQQRYILHAGPVASRGVILFRRITECCSRWKRRPGR